MLEPERRQRMRDKKKTKSSELLEQVLSGKIPVPQEVLEAEARIQKIARQHVKPGISVVDEFIRDRKAGKV